MDQKPGPQRGRFVFDPRYAEAIFHRRSGHRVLGRRLLPFSTWHRVQLEFANSPFLAGGEVSVPDLEIAVGICRTQYPDFFVYEARESGWRKLVWLLWAERVDVMRELRAFEAYMSDYRSPPKLWKTPKKAGQKTARADVDDSIAEVSFFIAHYHVDRAEAWNMPEGELAWMNVCASKQAGRDVRVWTPADERAFRAHVKKREETIAKLAEDFAAKENLSPEAALERARKHYWLVVKKNLGRHGFTNP